MRNTTKNSLNIESIASRLAHMGDDEVEDGISKMDKIYCFKQPDLQAKKNIEARVAEWESGSLEEEIQEFTVLRNIEIEPWN